MITNLKKNAQNGSLTAQDVFFENVNSSSLAKMYKDFKIQSVLVPGNGYKLAIITNSFKNNFVTKKWDSISNVYANYKSIKGFIDNGIMGKKTYMFPIKFEEKIRKSISDMSKSIKNYGISSTRITPLQISI